MIDGSFGGPKKRKMHTLKDADTELRHSDNESADLCLPLCLSTQLISFERPLQAWSTSIVLQGLSSTFFFTCVFVVCLNCILQNFSVCSAFDDCTFFCLHHNFPFVPCLDLCVVYPCVTYAAVLSPSTQESCTEANHRQIVMQPFESNYFVCADVVLFKVSSCLQFVTAGRCPWRPSKKSVLKMDG